MHNSEALKSEAVDWLNWNNFRICMYQKSLNLDPFFLLIAEVITTLSLFNLFIEFIDDNGNEQIHDEEGSDENVDYI